MPHVNVMHSKMHVKRSTVEAETAALRQGVADGTETRLTLFKQQFKSWFLNSFYFRTISRVHFMHHVKQNTNYGILPGNVDATMNSESRMQLKNTVDAYLEDIYL